MTADAPGSHARASEPQGLDDRSRWIDLGGPVHYLDFGGPANGPVIVCVHGLGGSSVNWSAIAPLLTDRFRVVAPDLAGHGPDLATFLPFDPAELGDHQKALPAIAKDVKRIAAIEEAVSRIPTTHALYNSDARRMAFLKPGSVHLVVTSPPYACDAGVIDKPAWRAGGSMCPRDSLNYSADPANLGRARGPASVVR